MIVWSRMSFSSCCGVGEKEIDSRDIHEIKLIELGKGQYLRREDKDDSKKKKKKERKKKMV